MPAANPFAPVIEVGAQASAGGATAGGSVSLGGSMGDNHAAALYLSLALVGLFLLWRNKFRFSTTVG